MTSSAYIVLTRMSPPILCTPWTSQVVWAASGLYQIAVDCSTWASTWNVKHLTSTNSPSTAAQCCRRPKPLRLALGLGLQAKCNVGVNATQCFMVCVWGGEMELQEDDLSAQCLLWRIVKRSHSLCSMHNLNHNIYVWKGNKKNGIYVGICQPFGGSTRLVEPSDHPDAQTWQMLPCSQRAAFEMHHILILWRLSCAFRFLCLYKYTQWGQQGKIMRDAHDSCTFTHGRASSRSWKPRLFMAIKFHSISITTTQMPQMHTKQTATKLKGEKT